MQQQQQKLQLLCTCLFVLSRCLSTPPPPPCIMWVGQELSQLTKDHPSHSLMYLCMVVIRMVRAPKLPFTLLSPPLLLGLHPTTTTTIMCLTICAGALGKMMMMMVKKKANSDFSNHQCRAIFAACQTNRLEVLQRYECSPVNACLSFSFTVRLSVCVFTFGRIDHFTGLVNAASQLTLFSSHFPRIDDENFPFSWLSAAATAA